MVKVLSAAEQVGMDPVPMTRARVALWSCALLAVAGAAFDAPLPSIAALLFTCAAVPLAVAVGGTPRHVRALFVPSRTAVRRSRPERIPEDAKQGQ